MADWLLKDTEKALIDLRSGNQIRVLPDGSGGYRVVLTIGSANLDLVTTPFVAEAEAIAEVKRLGAQLGYVS